MLDLSLKTIPLSLVSLLWLTPMALGMKIDDFENGNLANFDLSPDGIASVTDASFGVIPADGSFQVLLETGRMGTLTTPVFNPPLFPNTLEGFGELSGFLFTNGPGPISSLGAYLQGSVLQLKTPITVKSGESLQFNYNFLTDETNGVSPNNDLAFLSLNQTVIPITSVNNATFVSSPTAFISETQYQSFTYTFLSDGTFNLGLGIVDENAVSGHSGLLLDNIRVVAQTPEPSMLVGLVACLGLSWMVRQVRL